MLFAGKSGWNGDHRVKQYKLDQKDNVFSQIQNQEARDMEIERTKRGTGEARDALGIRVSNGL